MLSLTRFTFIATLLVGFLFGNDRANHETYYPFGQSLKFPKKFNRLEDPREPQWS